MATFRGTNGHIEPTRRERRCFAKVYEIIGGTKAKKMKGVILEIFTASDAEAAEEAYKSKLAKRGGCLGLFR